MKKELFNSIGNYDIFEAYKKTVNNLESTELICRSYDKQEHDFSNDITREEIYFIDKYGITIKFSENGDDVVHRNITMYGGIKKNISELEKLLLTTDKRWW